MPEWLRGWTANPLGIARAGSNPAVLVIIIIYYDKEHMPEWLRGWTANPLGIALAGSNPAVFVMIINNNFFFINII